MLCNSNFQFYLRASRCFEGSAGSLPPVIFLNGHTIRPTSYLPSSRFRVSTETSWAVVPGMYEIHCKHNSFVSSSVFNNNLSILIYECICVGTLEHIPRYMGRMSNNNNKMLINNSSCCFTIWIIYTVKWGIRYINKSFLIWIIPSMYLSHEAVNRACTIGFACIQYYQFYQFYRFYQFLCYFLSLGDNSGYMNSGYSDVRYKVYIWGFPCLDY